jgi:hypothetical protein
MEQKLDLECTRNLCVLLVRPCPCMLASVRMFKVAVDRCLRLIDVPFQKPFSSGETERPWIRITGLFLLPTTTTASIDLHVPGSSSVYPSWSLLPCPDRAIWISGCVCVGPVLVAVHALGECVSTNMHVSPTYCLRHIVGRSVMWVVITMRTDVEEGDTLLRATSHHGLIEDRGAS